MTGAAHNPGSWYAERCSVHKARERAVWDDYLRLTKGCAGDLERYTRSEPLAWRRLRRDLTELAHLRRRDALERDRSLTGHHALLRAV